MKPQTSQLILIALILAAAQTALAEPTVSLSMIASTSLEDSLPLEIFNGKSWSAEKGDRFVKVHMHADEPFELGKIEIESCSGSFTDDVNLYVNFDERVETLSAGGKTLTHKFESPVQVRSLTLNYNKNQDICLSQIRLLSGSDPWTLNIKTSKVISGTVQAKSIPNPPGAYEAMNLFDSRYEYAWATDKVGVGASLQFAFDEEQTIEKIKIWNGYQRSDVHCYSNSRVKAFEAAGDNGYRETVSVEDIMGAQVLSLPKPFKGRNLTLTVTQVYPGKVYKDLVISELRFFDGKDWLMLNPLGHIQKLREYHRSEFGKRGLEAALNNSLTDNNWILRLRTDGTFYLQGVEHGDMSQKNFYCLGSYEVQSSNPAGMQLRVFGLLRTQEEVHEEGEGDCNGCGRDCNNPQDDSGAAVSIFNQQLLIRMFEGKYRVENVSKKQIFPFPKLFMNIEK